MLSPQGGPAVDQGDGPADIGVGWQLPGSWALMEPLHALLEAGGRGSEGGGEQMTDDRWHTAGLGSLAGTEPSKACDPH